MLRPENEFDRLDPSDGYDADQTVDTDAGFTQAYVTLRASGNLFGSQVVREFKLPTVSQYGEASRANIVTQGLAAFFNAGGSWAELDQLIHDCRRIFPGGLTFQDFCLLDCRCNDDARTEYYWINPVTAEVVKWVRGECVERGLTVSDVFGETYDDDDDECEHTEDEVVQSLGDSESS